MQPKRIPRLFLAAFAGLLATAHLGGAEAGIEFTGFVRDDKGLSLALRNPASGYSKWVTLGQSFEEYTVRRLDETAGILIVARGDTEFRLPLVRSKVKLADSEPPPEIKKRVLNNLRQLAAAADQFFLENGVARATYDDLVGPTKYVKQVAPVDGEDYRGIGFAQGKPIEVRTGQGYVISYQP
jgi:hypothetical protein